MVLMHLAEHVDLLLVEPDRLEEPVDDARDLADDGGKRSCVAAQGKPNDSSTSVTVVDDLVDRVGPLVGDPVGLAVRARARAASSRPWQMLST